jgi:predicted trehalose synthase
VVVERRTEGAVGRLGRSLASMHVGLASNCYSISLTPIVVSVHWM